MAAVQRQLGHAAGGCVLMMTYLVRRQVPPAPRGGPVLQCLTRIQFQAVGDFPARTRGPLPVLRLLCELGVRRVKLERGRGFIHPSQCKM
jgi:hypothetical protein